MLPPSAHTLIEIALRTGVSYCLVLIGIRISGKREVGQMTPFDLTLLLLLSNSVQNAMTGPDTSLAGGAVAATTLLVLNYLVPEVSGGNRSFRKYIQGQPRPLVHEGAVIESHMAKEHVTVDELQRALREHGVATYKEAARAVLEVDGSISVLKYDDIEPTTSTHLNRRGFLKKNRSYHPAAAAATPPGVRTSRIILASSNSSRQQYLLGFVSMLAERVAARLSVVAAPAA